MTQPRALTRGLAMLALVTAGEAVFLLPFVIPRVFRPTVLEVFAVDNLELGLAQSIYGVVAMVAYFAGGPLADRFSARWLMAAALSITGASGVALILSRSLATLELLYGLWGVSTVLLFWAAMIRATRVWGGAETRGWAFGLLDGGRGLVAALMASATVTLFAALLPVDAGVATLEQRRAAFEWVLWSAVGVTTLVALPVLLWIPDDAGARELEHPTATKRGAGLLLALRKPSVWLQAMIIVCAYVGYKSIDDVSLYASETLGYDDVEAAQLSTLAFWVRPFAAVLAGLLADRLRASRVVLVAFALMLLGDLGLATDLLPLSRAWVIAMTVALSCVGVYAMRGLYFALFDEARVPLAHTGSAVGVVSLIGYTPDVFMGPLMGLLTERDPSVGHRQLFYVVAAFAALGLLTTVGFRRLAERSGA